MAFQEGGVSPGVSLLCQAPTVWWDSFKEQTHMWEETDLPNDDLVDCTLCPLADSCTVCLINTQQVLSCSEHPGDADRGRGGKVDIVRLAYCNKLLTLALKTPQKRNDLN